MRCRVGCVFPAVLAFVLAGPAGAEPCLDPVPGDFDGDFDVDVADFGRFTACFTGSGVPCSDTCCEADLDGDGDVDIADFAMFSANFTGSLPRFDYGDSPRPDREAELLAVETSGELLAPDELYDRIHRDLGLIRAFDSRVVDVIHDPRWVPNQVIVKLIEGMPTDNYDELNRFYGAVDCENLFDTWYVVTLPDVIVNVPVLADIYAEAPEVEFAEPNFIFGTDDEITVFPGEGVFGYEIIDGFCDCFDGCDCFKIFRFTVTDGGDVQLESYREEGLPWCDFKSGSC